MNLSRITGLAEAKIALYLSVRCNIYLQTWISGQHASQDHNLRIHIPIRTNQDLLRSQLIPVQPWGLFSLKVTLPKHTQPREDFT
jgi:hypothetical protein